MDNTLDKKLVAQKIRARLEKRLAAFLECEVADLPRLKIGTLVHTLFLFDGMDETIGGFHSTMRGIIDLIGFDLTWDVESKAETPKVVIQ